MNVIILLVLFWAILFAFLTQKKQGCVAGCSADGLAHMTFSMPLFLLSFALLGLMCFFCKSGFDMPTYMEFYSTWSFSDLSSASIEPGNKVLFIFLRMFIKNPYVGIGMVKLLSIGMVYIALYLIRDRINIGLAITSYVLLLYIFNFHLIRMMLALGIVFLAFAKEITGKSMQCFIFLLVAFAFHYSSIIVLFAYMCYMISRKNFTVLKTVLVIGLMAVFYVNIEKIVGGLVSNVGLFQKYASYSGASVGSFGFAQIILFVPTLIILIRGYCEDKDKNFYKLSFFLGIMTFFAGSLGYVYKVVGRTVYYFYFFFISYGAATPLMKNDIVLRCGKLRINLSTFALLLYLAMQFYICYINGRYFVTNGLTEYIFIWES